MTEKRSSSDTEINAYLDGELTGADRDAFEALIDSDPVLAAKLAGYRDVDDRLRRAFEPVMDEGVPPNLLETVMRERRYSRLSLKWAVAATIVAFMAGGMAGWYIDESQTGDPSAARETLFEAQIAHRVFVSEVRHPVEVAAADYDHLVGWLSKRMGHKLVAPDFRAQGFELIGGRLLPGYAAAAAQFMYENDAADRLTLYIGKNPAASKTAFRLSEADGVRTFYWLDGEFGYALSGSIGSDTLLSLAHMAYDQLSDVKSGSDSKNAT